MSAIVDFCCPAPAPGEGSRSPKWLKAYAVYTFLKYMGAASFLLWVAVTRKAKIEAFYTAKSCSACYSQSQQHPELIYEFGVCSVQYITNATGTNLMPFRWFNSEFGAETSTVSLYTTFGVIAFVLVLICCGFTLLLAFPSLFGGPEASRQQSFALETALSTFTFACVFLLIYNSNDVFQLHRVGKDHCYVSAWGSNYFLAQSVLTFCFVCCWIILELSRCAGSDNALFGAFLACSVLMFGFVVFGVVLSIRNYQTSGEIAHLAFNCLLFLTLLEIPKCVCGPRLHSRVRGMWLLDAHSGAVDRHAYRVVPQHDDLIEDRQRRQQQQQQQRRQASAAASGGAGDNGSYQSSDARSLEEGRD